jgi:hypothetical protein
MPRSSNEISLRAGRVMNYGDGIYGGMFISAMYAAAFFSDDTEMIVRAGVSALPGESEYARLIEDVLGWWRESPDDWQSTWEKIHDKWNSGEMCPEGAVKTFNIDAKINGAYVVLGLLYGAGDFEKNHAHQYTGRAGLGLQPIQCAGNSWCCQGLQEYSGKVHNWLEGYCR